MQARTAINAVHFAMLLIAYGLFESATYCSSVSGMDLRIIVFFASFIAAMTGLILLVWKYRGKDRYIIVISTILSSFLLIWVISRR
jgi:hypothetical protein